MRRLTVLGDLDIAMIHAEVADDATKLPATHLRFQSGWVSKIIRTIQGICVEIEATIEPNGILA